MGGRAEKKLKSGINALLHNKCDGKITAGNVKPKVTGGKRKVIDGHFEGAARFSNTGGGEKDL